MSGSLAILEQSRNMEGPIIDLLPSRPAFLAALRTTMGATVGLAFGAASGHPIVWLTIGVAVGLAFARALAPSR